MKSRPTNSRRFGGADPSEVDGRRIRQLLQNADDGFRRRQPSHPPARRCADAILRACSSVPGNAEQENMFSPRKEPGLKLYARKGLDRRIQPRIAAGIPEFRARRGR